MKKNKANTATQPSNDEFDAAITWESERLVQMRKSSKTAWIVAGVSVVAMLLSIIAVVGLTPLKETKPFVIRVDKSTGIVDVVKGLKNSPNTYDKAVTRYFAARYIRAREGYSRGMASTFYTRVGLMSSTSVGREYAEEFSPDNPNSPLRVFGNNGKVTVKIISISFISDDQLSIRFIKNIKRSHQSQEEQHLIATMKFHYSRTPMSNTDRLENPLGFQVDDYRLARESIGG